jgi:hypothetical protein
MSPEEIAVSLQNDLANAQRQQLGSQVNAFFNDPSRQAAQQKTIQDQLAQSLTGIGDQYKQEYVQGAQSAGSRGLQGSSVDIEERMAAGAQRDIRAAETGAQAQTQGQAFQNQNTAQRQQLMQLINSQDPAQAQAAQAQLQALNAQTGGISAQTGIQGQQRQLAQFGQNAQSQAWGNAVTGIANQIRGNPQLGGGLGAWLGGTGAA